MSEILIGSLLQVVHGDRWAKASGVSQARCAHRHLAKQSRDDSADRKFNSEGAGDDERTARLDAFAV